VLWFRIGGSKEDVLLSVAKLDRVMFFAGLGIVVITPLCAYILAGRATRPLAKINATTARLKPENLHERLHLRGTGDELDQLSETFNGMLDRIASYIDRHRDFIADAAHELRSPLTAIRSSVEVALNRTHSTDEYQTLLFDVLEECSGLAILVNRLLFLAEGDAGRLSSRDQVASMEKLVRESADMFQAVAESRGVDLVVEGLEPGMVRGDELHIRQVVRNLIDNAVKFTKGPGRVTVGVRADSARKQVRLTVNDTGRGIPAEDLPRIFDRFYRADKSRSRHEDEGGFGLGLSICHAVVKSLDGDIKVESVVGRGTTFTVVLPMIGEPVGAALAAS
jgi:heavy metal sensor kinase